MTVRLNEGGDIELAGDCAAEDADALLRHLIAAPGATVDWRACDHAHTAVVQVLLASGAAVRGPARSVFLTQWVEPLLGAG